MLLPNYLSQPFFGYLCVTFPTIFSTTERYMTSNSLISALLRDRIRKGILLGDTERQREIERDRER
jgi:hypothetical protein